MTIGESGTRKSLLDDFGFCVLREAQAELWRPHRVLQHAHDFDATLPGRGRNLTHDIAG